MGIIDILEKIKDRLIWILERFLSVIFVSMFLSVTFQIFARNFLRLPFVWTEELARTSYTWIALIGAVVIQMLDEHISVDFIINALPEKGRKIFKLISHFLVMVFCACALYGGIVIVKMNVNTFMSTLPRFITYAWLYMSVPISMTLILITLINRSILLINELKNHSQSTESQSSKKEKTM